MNNETKELLVLVGIKISEHLKGSDEFTREEILKLLEVRDFLNKDRD